MHAKQALLAGAGVGLLVVAAVACSANDSAVTSLGSAPQDAGAATNGGENRPSTSTGPANAIASGIVLVHAANFPSFRLCFENFLDQKPQPDSDIMPESNLVGVETGSFVRLPPMDAPGATYVIDERRIRGLDSTCRELLKGANAPLASTNDYDMLLEPLAAPLGQKNVDVVAITGCASSGTLSHLGVDESSCAKDYGTLTGNLHAHVVSLTATGTGLSGQSLPVQLYQLSTAIDALAKTTDATLSVTFGDLTAEGVLGQSLAVPALFAPGVPTSVTIDPSSEAVYGTHGFRISVGPADHPTVVDQSLATVQDLSSSNELPSTYYGAASNYALLLLGAPTPPMDAGIASARARMHILAVPVIDPSTLDAGTDASAPDGG